MHISQIWIDPGNKQQHKEILLHWFRYIFLKHLQSAENYWIFPVFFQTPQSRQLGGQVQAIQYIFTEAGIRTFEM